MKKVVQPTLANIVGRKLVAIAAHRPVCLLVLIILATGLKLQPCMTS